MLRGLTAVLLGLALCLAPTYAQPRPTPSPSTAPAPPPAVPPAPPSPALPVRYLSNPAQHVLRPGDEVEIVLPDLPDLERMYTIRVDGSFYHPVAGEIRAAGKTLGQLRSELGRLFAAELRNPRFELGLNRVALGQVTVLGEVTRPGRVEVPPDGSVQEALAQAGGFQEDADRSLGTLIRGGVSSPISLDPSARSPELLEGDILLVGQGQSVTVLGEVMKEGQYVVARDATSPQRALSLAQGVKPTAALERVLLFRPSLGKSTVLNLSPSADALAPPFQVLQTGDVLMVPPRRAVVVAGTPKAVPLVGGENVLDVLALAGTEGNYDDIRISHVSSDPEQKVSPSRALDLYRFFDQGDRSVLVPIEDGDVIWVDVSKGNELDFLNYIYTILWPIGFVRSL